MAFVYILYSQKINRFYVGSCLNLEERIKEHNENYKNGFTKRADDWELFYSLDDLNYEQARMIELYIKKMKSRKYFEDLKKYPTLSDKLRNLK